MSFDLTFGGRLRIPLIVAPMFLVSTPKLALAACSQGIMGSFPSHSSRTREVFEGWLNEMDEGITALESAGEKPAPYAVNIVVHQTNPRCEGDLELCKEHDVKVVLTSKGAPDDVFKEIHSWGGVVFHDVASQRHAEKALEAGADGVIAVCGGAGGHTGTQNPFALVAEIREITDKPIILSGALGTGRDVLAAKMMGADMAYMGTRFIACTESGAPEDYWEMVLGATAKDVFYTTGLDGFPANYLAPSLEGIGLDLDELTYIKPGEVINAEQAKQRYKGIWSAGHGVNKVKTRESAVDVAKQIIAEYEQAIVSAKEMLG